MIRRVVARAGRCRRRRACARKRRPARRPPPSRTCPRAPSSAARCPCSLASPLLDAQQDDVEIFIRPGQAGIGGERRQQRLPRDERPSTASTSSMGSSSSPLRSKNGPPSGRRTVGKRSGRCLQRRGEPLGRRIGQFGRRAVDHDHGQVLQLRERLVELDPALAPLQLRRDQLAVSAVMAKLLGQVDERRRRQQRARQAARSTDGGC